MFHEGKGIKEMVRLKGLTQQQMADKMKISRNHLINMFEKKKWDNDCNSNYTGCFRYNSGIGYGITISNSSIPVFLQSK